MPALSSRWRARRRRGFEQLRPSNPQQMVLRSGRCPRYSDDSVMSAAATVIAWPPLLKALSSFGGTRNRHCTIVSRVGKVIVVEEQSLHAASNYQRTHHLRAQARDATSLRAVSHASSAESSMHWQSSDSSTPRQGPGRRPTRWRSLGFASPSNPAGIGRVADILVQVGGTPA